MVDVVIGLVATVVPPEPFWTIGGNPVEALGVKVCAPVPVNISVPEFALKLLSEVKLIVGAATFKVEDPKSRPPPVILSAVPTI